MRSSLLPNRPSSAFQNTSSSVTDATSTPAAAQYTPRRRSGPTRRAQSANPRATSTITPTRITVAERVRSMTAPDTTSQPIPCARRTLPAASSEPKTMSPSSATMPSRLRFPTMPSIGPPEKSRPRDQKKAFGASPP